MQAKVRNVKERKAQRAKVGRCKCDGSRRVQKWITIRKCTVQFVAVVVVIVLVVVGEKDKQRGEHYF